MGRIDRFYRSRRWTPAAAQRRAEEVLEFCEIIIRIHREAGDREEANLEGLRDLERWADDILRRSV